MRASAASIEACEKGLLDSTSLSHFAGIDLGYKRVPDATTLLKFHRLLTEPKPTWPTVHSSRWPTYTTNTP